MQIKLPDIWADAIVTLLLILAITYFFLPNTSIIMNKQINSELALLLKAHVKGQQDSPTGFPCRWWKMPTDESKAYRVAYINPLNKTLTYANKEKAI